MSEPTTTAETTQQTEAKEATIIVNTQPKQVLSRTVTYTEVVALAYPTPPAPDTKYTVLYENAIKPNHEGSLVAGGSVEVKEKGTIFDVTPTNKS